MEMLHTATLVHDDIIDNADLRRNRPSVNARFGNQTAVLMGDWLYMSAFETSLRERSLENSRYSDTPYPKDDRRRIDPANISSAAPRSARKLFRHPPPKDRVSFLGLLRDRRDPCRLDGRKQRGACAITVLNLGIAFQLADDLLDLTSEASDARKGGGNRPDRR